MMPPVDWDGPAQSPPGRLHPRLRRVAKGLGMSRARRRGLARRIRRMTRPAWLGTAHGRTLPFSDFSGQDRGTPIDRVYIEQFLLAHRDAFRGRVLEVQNSQYTERFGTDVEAADILDVDPANPRATILGDLGLPSSLPEAAFDCFVLTQTLQYIFDPKAAALSAYRVLRPGGVLLATAPAVSKVDAKTPELDCWRFTEVSCARLFEEAFGEGQVEVRSYGNAICAAAFLLGMAAEDLRPAHLELDDERFPVIIAVRAVRPSD